MLILLVWVILFVHMSVYWLWYRVSHNPSVVDIGWATGLALSGLIFLFTQSMGWQAMTFASILLIWGIRLAFHLWFTRIRKKHVDKRYIALSQEWKIAKPLGFFLNFQLQGLLILIIALPWYFTAKALPNHWSLLDSFAYLLALLAICAETIADLQLERFKHQHSGEVCKQGLWRFSRHPNYFFEWLTWCAFTLFALSHPFGWLALISPITLFIIMTQITGPRTEQGSIESKGEAYRAYQQSTPMFFPNVFKQRLNKRNPEE